MKFNKWTLGLAAVGVVSLASAARADESKPSALQTALSNTTISGYVSASANIGLTQNYAASPAANIPFEPKSKEQGFNLDVVKLSISKPEDSTPWASGYDVDLLFGPDATGYNTSANAVNGAADFAVKQAYVTLNTPIGNGLDWKIGVFDSPLGYEVYDSGSNPNYTHSWGYYLEPTELTGVQASYKVNDQWSFSGGVANTSVAGINARNTASGYTGDANTGAAWQKAYFGTATYTAPSSWGWAGGSTAFAGILYGSVDTSTNLNEHMQGNQINYYGGLTLNTPWKQVTGGVAFDYAQNFGGGTETISPLVNTYAETDEMALGLYTTYKATDKLSLSARGEYVEADSYTGDKYTSSDNLIELTGTIEYDMWANVQTRAEIRWDQDLSTSEGMLLSNGERDAVGLYANVIYKF